MFAVVNYLTVVIVTISWLLSLMLSEKYFFGPLISHGGNNLEEIFFFLNKIFRPQNQILYVDPSRKEKNYFFC